MSRFQSAATAVEDAGFKPARSKKKAKAKKSSAGIREPGFDRNARTSRAAQSRENAADPRVRAQLVTRRPKALPDIPARPGMAQRWVRVAIGSNEDVDNMSRAEAVGWEPRKADTLPSGVKAPIIRKGDLAGYIGVRGNVLMERPEEISQAYRQQNREAANAQETYVREQLLQEHRPGVKGLGRPKMTHKSSVGVRSRRPALVQEDDDGLDED